MTYTNGKIVIADSKKELKNFLKCLKICGDLFRLNGIWTYIIKGDTERCDNLEQYYILSSSVTKVDDFELLDIMQSMRQYRPTNR